MKRGSSSTVDDGIVKRRKEDDWHGNPLNPKDKADKNILSADEVLIKWIESSGEAARVYRNDLWWMGEFPKLFYKNSWSETWSKPTGQLKLDKRLFEACLAGDYNAMEDALMKGADVKLSSINANPFLLLMVNRVHAVQSGAGFDAYSKSFFERKNIESKHFDLLIKHGADVNEISRGESTPLSSAASDMGMVKYVPELLRIGADPSVRGERSLHIFFALDQCVSRLEWDTKYAAEESGGVRREFIKWSTKSEGGEFRNKTEQHLAIAFKAINQKCKEIGLDLINTPYQDFSLPPIYGAVKCSRVLFTKLLLEGGADTKHYGDLRPLIWHHDYADSNMFWMLVSIAPEPSSADHELMKLKLLFADLFKPKNITKPSTVQKFAFLMECLKMTNGVQEGYKKSFVKAILDEAALEAIMKELSFYLTAPNYVQKRVVEAIKEFELLIDNPPEFKGLCPEEPEKLFNQAKDVFLSRVDEVAFGKDPKPLAEGFYDLFYGEENANAQMEWEEFRNNKIQLEEASRKIQGAQSAISYNDKPIQPMPKRMSIPMAVSKAIRQGFPMGIEDRIKVMEENNGKKFTKQEMEKLLHEKIEKDKRSRIAPDSRSL